MPIALAVGSLFHRVFAGLDVLSPYIIASMLFVTFTRVRMGELRLQKVHFGQLVFQIVGGVGLYLLLKWCGVNEIVCQGVMICAFIPTAMASVVVGGMMGGNVTTMTTFMLLSHMTMALVAPVVFSLMGSGVTLPFLTSFWLVLRKLLLLVVAPFVAAQLLGVVAPKGFEWVQKHQSLSFYLWLSSLVIIIASTTEYILSQPIENLRLEVAMAVLSGVLCIGQFSLGKWWGRRHGDEVAGAQSVGQKNTLLAVLLAQTYLHPLSSVAPTAYIIWQNLYNSRQLARHAKRSEKSE